MTIENQGFNNETFNVIAYVNTTVIHTENIINLAGGSSKTVSFTWNTLGFPKGVYTLSANASQVLNETDTDDNSFIDDTVRVTMEGDIAPAFGEVDIVGIVTVAIHFGAERGQPEYDPIADINDDGVTDIVDIVIIAIHFGEERAAGKTGRGLPERRNRARNDRA
jgi:hypothetical protein